MQVLHESPTEIKRSILCQIYKQEENKGEKGGGGLSERGKPGMEEDRKVGGGSASWLLSPAYLLCVRKQLWPTEDYITYWDTHTYPVLTAVSL